MGSTRHLITGAAGFIGSHLATRLAAEVEEPIVCLDNLQFGDWSNIPIEADRYERVEADLKALDDDDMQGLLKGVDTLFHMAAQKLNNAESPEALIECNVTATERLFRAAAAAGCRRIVFASSLYAHGGTQLPAMRESDRAEPKTLYGVTKLAGEGLLRSVAHERSIETVALRFFFVFGPRQYPGLGYPSVIVRSFERMKRGEAPTVFGDGRQALDYLFIDDAVEAAVAAARADVDGEIINVGSGRSITILDLVEKMRRTADFGEPAVFAPADWTAGTHRVANVGKARDLLQWQATTSMDQALGVVWNWICDQRRAAS